MVAVLSIGKLRQLLRARRYTFSRTDVAPLTLLWSAAGRQTGERVRLAIQNDFVRQPGGQEQSFSNRWKELAEHRGVEVQTVDVFRQGALELIRQCDAFMWRYGFGETERGFAKRLIPAIEHGLHIPVFPNWKTSWHFEDKITQGYLLEAAGIPVPRTWTFWERDDALEFCRDARYPFVAKLTAGIRSNNVVLVHDPAQAERLINHMFGAGVRTFHAPPVSIKKRIGRTKLIRALRGRKIGHHPPQSGYFYAQEFLSGNAFDTRVTVIGNRAFAFRRFNREGDFRASGSGNISWEPSEVDLDTVHLAFEVAEKLQTQSIAIDGMRRGDTRLVGEISYTYAAWAIERCPGHWATDSLGKLRWVEGHLRAEDAIFEDFVRRLRLT